MKRGLKDSVSIAPIACPCAVATYAPMKRGLKASNVQSLLSSHAVATYAPMKRGLKGLRATFIS